MAGRSRLFVYCDRVHPRQALRKEGACEAGMVSLGVANGALKIEGKVKVKDEQDMNG